MFFKLPDLGEGLQEAEVLEWHIRAGESVSCDQILVSVETAKAIVDIPAPKTGVVDKLIVQVGEMAHIGEPLLCYREDSANTAATSADNATVVGELPNVASSAASGDDFIIGAAIHSDSNAEPSSDSRPASLDTSYSERLTGPRRTMAKAMSNSQANIAAATLMDDADIHNWPQGTDTSARLCRAIAYACQQEPLLNAHFDGQTLSRQLHSNINLGIAVDSSDGLFVPVIESLEQLDLDQIRVQLNALKTAVNNRTIRPKHMQGATIALSNFGLIAKQSAQKDNSKSKKVAHKGGRYGSPIVVAPQVAIIGAGRISLEPAAIDGEVALRRLLPLSLSFDHRCVTGAEAARFLAALISDLESQK